MGKGPFMGHVIGRAIEMRRVLGPGLWNERIKSGCLTNRA